MYAESRRPSPWQGACLADAWFKPWRRRLGGGPRTKRALPGPAVASCRCAGRGSNSRLPAHTTRRRSQRDRGVNSHARIDRPRQCYDGGVRAHSQRTLPRLAVAQCAQEKSVRGERRRCCEHCRAAPRAKSKGSATFSRSRPPARRLSARRGLFAERLARRQASRDTSSSGRAFKLSHERLNPHHGGKATSKHLYSFSGPAATIPAPTKAPEARRSSPRRAARGRAGRAAAARAHAGVCKPAPSRRPGGISEASWNPCVTTSVSTGPGQQPKSPKRLTPIPADTRGRPDASAGGKTKGRMSRPVGRLRAGCVGQWED